MRQADFIFDIITGHQFFFFHHMTKNLKINKLFIVCIFSPLFQSFLVFAGVFFLVFASKVETQVSDVPVVLSQVAKIVNYNCNNTILHRKVLNFNYQYISLIFQCLELKEKTPNHKANRKSKCFSLRWMQSLYCLSNHKLTKWIRLEGPLNVELVQPCTLSELPRAGSPGPHPGTL